MMLLSFTIWLKLSWEISNPTDVHFHKLISYKVYNLKNLISFCLYGYIVSLLNESISIPPQD